MDELKLSLEEADRIVNLGKALSSITRIDILKLLNNEELNVNDIALRLGIPTSSAAAHVNALEKADIISTTLRPASRGSMKICSLNKKSGYINFTIEEAEHSNKSISIPVGQYTDYKVEPTCGLVGPDGPIGTEDSPNSYFSPDRMHATLLWFGNGYVEYKFPGEIIEGGETAIMFSAELCSETHEYEMDWPSDITVWINGVDAGTWRCPSDFGGRRGRYNPAWWPDKNTQYGVLKTWKITNKGTYIDDKKVSKMTLNDYMFSKADFITVRIGIKEDAKYKGGINIFGEGFGDSPQSIKLSTIK